MKVIIQSFCKRGRGLAALLCAVALCCSLLAATSVRTFASAAQPWIAWEIDAAPDGTSRVLWTSNAGTGYSVSIWKLDSAGRVVAMTPAYGRYTEGEDFWMPANQLAHCLVVEADGSTSLLWENPRANSTQVSIWKFDSDLRRTTISPTYGPYPVGADGTEFWAPYKFVAGPNNTTRLIWSVENEHKGPGAMGGIVSVWSLGSNGATATMGPAYGPYSDSEGDWIAGQYHVAPDGTGRLLWVNQKIAAGTLQSEAISFWTLSATGAVTHFGTVYGPYASWRPMNFDIDPADSSLRLLWYNNSLPFTGNTPILVWALTTRGDATAMGPSYGPYSNWHVTGLYANADSTSTLAWSNYDSVAGIQAGPFSYWSLSSEGQKIGTTPTYGPYSGWNLAEAVRNPANGDFRLLWRSGDGQTTSAWSLNSNGADPTFGPSYGPYTLTP